MPRVSFVVPCFRLAHLLPQCLSSILNQTYRDIEVLVMDDCSPDRTPEVTASFSHDGRVTHVRHRYNLGHLRNFNDGIQRTRGEFVWLLSADDYLTSTDVVAKFVRVLDDHPSVGYVFCPAIKTDGASNGGLTAYHGPNPAVFPGRQFLQRLLRGNSVPANGALVRKTCYLDAGLFPLDLPFAGDWYLWSAMAFKSDVAYVPTPMLAYRFHAGNMTKKFQQARSAMVADELAVRWRMQRMIDGARDADLGRECRVQMAYDCAKRFLQDDPAGWPAAMTAADLDVSLAKHCESGRERTAMRSAILSAMGDECFARGQRATARQHYLDALRVRPVSPRTALKYLLLSMGSTGDRVRRAGTTPRVAEPSDSAVVAPCE